MYIPWHTIYGPFLVEFSYSRHNFGHQNIYDVIDCECSDEAATFNHSAYHMTWLQGFRWLHVQARIPTDGGEVDMAMCAREHCSWTHTPYVTSWSCICTCTCCSESVATQFLTCKDSPDLNYTVCSKSAAGAKMWCIIIIHAYQRFPSLEDSPPQACTYATCIGIAMVFGSLFMLCMAVSDVLLLGNDTCWCVMCGKEVSLKTRRLLAEVQGVILNGWLIL